ncbi:hypothetical protein NPIL_625471 [Nephila pilipes]|uniref:Uncharacterized protein n=1 Tax=Nephila pilipes TaxID=299642 RepID=A0A8X6PN64_NEPPI|nr:hypothetical protein NPIL_625471 [Nephila pilipes]
MLFMVVTKEFIPSFPQVPSFSWVLHQVPRCIILGAVSGNIKYDVCHRVHYFRTELCFQSLCERRHSPTIHSHLPSSPSDMSYFCVRPYSFTHPH